MQKKDISQKIIIFNRDGKLLTIHRTSTAPSDANKWDLQGGVLDYGEEAISGIIRETKEETGLESKNIKPFDVESHIDSEGEFWVTIAYTAEIVSDKAILSFEHDESRWVTPEEFLKLKSSDKIMRFVKKIIPT